MKIHWHTNETPCLLEGRPVTLENWVGGIVELSDGHYGELSQDWGVANWSEGHGTTYYVNGKEFVEYCKIGNCHLPLHSEIIRPVYPPAGWERGRLPAFDVPLLTIGNQVYVPLDGTSISVWVCSGRYGDEPEFDQDGSFCKALALELTNAVVLASFLKKRWES